MDSYTTLHHLLSTSLDEQQSIMPSKINWGKGSVHCTDIVHYLEGPLLEVLL